MTKKQRKQCIQRVRDLLTDAGVTASLLGNEDETFEFADAIVGIVWEPKASVIYDADKVLKDFMRMEKWTLEQAQEWFDYNVLRGAAYAKNPPTFIDRV